MVALPPEMLNALLCPDCKSTLSQYDENLQCNGCSRNFEIKDGIPLLTPKKE